MTYSIVTIRAKSRSGAWCPDRVIRELCARGWHPRMAEALARGWAVQATGSAEAS